MFVVSRSAWPSICEITSRGMYVVALQGHGRRMAGDVARQVEINSEFLGEQAQVFLVLAVTGSNVHVESRSPV